MKHLAFILLVLFLPGKTSAQFVQHPGLLRVEQLLEQGRFPEAMQVARTMQQDSTLSELERAYADFLMGRCFHSLEDLKAASSQYKLALKKLTDDHDRLRATIQCYLTTLLSDSIQVDSLINDALALCAKNDAETSTEAALAHFANAHYNYRINKDNIAHAALKRALSIQSRLKDVSESLNGRIWSLQGNVYRRQQRFDAAMNAFIEAERYFLLAGGEQNLNLNAVYYNIGACFGDLGQHRRAIVYYENAVLAYKSLNEQHPNLAIIYNSMGNSFKELGDYNTAVAYIENAVGFHTNREGIYQSGLGDVYQKMGNLEKAKDCFQTSIRLLLPVADRFTADFARPHHNLALTFLEEKNYTKALEYEQIALHLRLQNQANIPLDVARSYLGLAQINTGLNKRDDAIVYTDSALIFQYRAVPSGRHPEIANTYLAQADNYLSTNDFSATERCLDSAFAAAGYRQGMAFSDIPSPLEYLSALGAKANFLIVKYKHKGDKTALIRAAEVYRTKAEALQSQRRNLSDDESKSILMRQHFDLYAQAIENNYLIGDEIAGTEAFQYAEQSKGLNLLDVFLKTQARQFAGVPDSVLRREQTLLAQIAETEKTRTALVAGDKQAADSTLKNINSALLELNRQYQSFLKELENDYPDLYRLKNDNRAISVAEVQKRLLRPGQTLLEYFVADTSIFIFLVRPDRFQMVRLPKDFPLAELVQRMQYGIHGFYTAPKNKQTEALRRSTHDDYTEAAATLYQKLIAPVEADLDSALIIIPDPALGEMPFEALLAERPKSRWLYPTYAYLGKTKTITYCYSANLLHAMREKQHKRKPDINFLGFAPFFDGDTTQFAAVEGDNLKDDRLESLDHSGEEIWRLARTMNGRALYGSDATFARLRGEGAQTRILHFSTHGLTDTLQGDNARLWFANPAKPGGHEAYFAKDIYPLVLNADLVVFSACQTGIGQLRVGEGVISLARAFAYAGAKSLVNTLWSVREDSTKELMWLFYDNMAAGMPHDQALAKAKRTFMARFQDKGWAHPFFWAGFVGVGM